MEQASQASIGIPSIPLRLLDIRENPHLRGGEPTTPLAHIHALKFLYKSAVEKNIVTKEEAARLNLAKIPDKDIEEIDRLFGESALFRLLFLAMSTNSDDFRHFYYSVSDELTLRRIIAGATRTSIQYDNHLLPAGRDIKRFCSNVVQPSLSRKLYNPGVREGFLVYGIGGPRILVSYPFRGASEDLYDVYTNSLDVISSLMVRGYVGTFLCFDFLPSLNFEHMGALAWVLWFSKIASHSDLIVFVKEENQEFTDSQQIEIQFAPDRVPKKVVSLKANELRWARDYRKEEIPKERMRLIPGKGLVSAAEWDAEEAKLARPFIEGYGRGNIPDDRLIVLYEDGSIREFPLDSY